MSYALEALAIVLGSLAALVVLGLLTRVLLVYVHDFEARRALRREDDLERKWVERRETVSPYVAEHTDGSVSLQLGSVLRSGRHLFLVTGDGRGFEGAYDLNPNGATRVELKLIPYPRTQADRDEYRQKGWTS